MRILFQSRTNLFTASGGDTIQILKTKEYLEKIGCIVDVSLELYPDVSSYDVVHLFNLMAPQEILPQLNNAKRQGKPVVLSTIYGLYTEFEQKARGGIGQVLANCINSYYFEFLKTIARYYKANDIHKGVRILIRKGYYKSMKYIADNVDVFLPNSENEMRRVAREFKLASYKYNSVPNAVDVNVFDYGKVQADSDLEKYKDCILCAARIEGRKSQLNLIKALKGTGYKLVLVGDFSPNQVSYIKKVKKEAGDNVFFLGAVEQDKLAKLYKLARVHALISWMETPGLSSLEAAIMKTNIVVTKKGDTEDYFGSYAYYCEPDDIESIRNAVIEAYKNPFNMELYNHIRENYTWDKTALETLKGYKMALNS